MNELAVDLRADRHLDELVLNVADHPRLLAELDSFRRAHVALDRAVQQHVRNQDGPLDAAPLADAEHRARVLRRLHVTFHVAVHVAAARELDISLDPRVRANQRFDRCLTPRLLTQHDHPLPLTP